MNLVMYDVVWLAMMLLITGSKYLEYISSVKIMHNDNNNFAWSITEQIMAINWTGVPKTVQGTKGTLYSQLKLPF
jgi:hypothetical protein